MKNNASIWGRILWPVAAYLVLSIALRTAFVQAAGMSRETASCWTGICLFLPVCLLYAYRWRSEISAHQAEKYRASADPERGFIWWLAAAVSLAAASAGLAGTDGAMAAGSALGVLSTCVLGPFLEEVLYRGQFIGRGMPAIGALPLLVMSTLLFAASHGTWEQILLAVPAGLILGLLYLKEQRLTGVVITHCAANTLIYCAGHWQLAAGKGLLLAALAAEAVIAALLYAKVFRRKQ